MLLQRMRYFLETAKQGSFSGAARELYISPQAMTKQIGILEEEIGAKMLERTPQGVRLTDFGRYANEEFQKVVDHVERVMRELRQKAVQTKNVINIGIFTGYAHEDVVSPMLSLLMTQYPQYLIQLQMVDVMEGRKLFFDGELDLLLTYSHEEESWGESRVFAFSSGEPKVMVSMRHPWVMKDRLTLEDLAAERFLKMKTNNIHYRIQVEDSFYANIPNKETVEVSNSDTLYVMLQQGNGFSVFPENQASKKEKLKTFDYPGKAIQYYQILVYHPNPEMEEIVTRIREEFELPDAWEAPLHYNYKL